MGTRKLLILAGLLALASFAGAARADHDPVVVVRLQPWIEIEWDGLASYEVDDWDRPYWCHVHRVRHVHHVHHIHHEHHHEHRHIHRHSARADRPRHGGRQAGGRWKGRD